MELLEACWRELDNEPGCYVWDVAVPDHQVVLNGDCVSGLLSGPGTLRETWRWAGGGTGWYEETGAMRDGKRHGRWVGRGDQGSGEGEFMDGQQEGHWVHRYHPANVSSRSYYVEEGHYVSGKKEGLWVLRWHTGDRVEAPYRNGLRHSRQH